MTVHGLTMTHFGGQGWQKRVQMPVDRLIAIEEIGERMHHSMSAIQKAFRHWQDRTEKGRVRIDNFQMAPADDSAFLLIDVTPESPYHYRFSVKRDKYFRWLEEKRLAEFPYSEIIRSCTNEYYTCKMTGDPVGHHITHDLNGFKRDYLRLLLPLADQRGRVAALACVSRHLDYQAPDELRPSTPRG